MDRERRESGIPLMPHQEEYDYCRGLMASLEGAVHAGYLSDFDGKIVSKIVKPDAAYEPDGQFFDRLQLLLSERARPSEDQLFDVGVDIGSRICDLEKTARGRILGYLNTCVNMDCLKVGLAGYAHSTHTVHQMLAYTCEVLVEKIPADQKTIKLFDVIIESLQSSKAKQPFSKEPYDWLVLKMQTLVQLHGLVHGFKHSVLDYYYAKSPEEVKKEEALPSVNEQVVQLNFESMTHRKFGTKPAYIEASIGGSWVFYDGDDFKNTLLKHARNIRLPQFAAVVLHSPHENLRNLRLDTTKVDYSGGASMLVVSGGFKDIAPDLLVVIGLDGTMSVDYHGIMTIDTLLRDRPAVAQSLKAELASNFYDLSMPVDNSSTPHPRNYPSFPHAEKRNFDPIRQLLIPRIRRLDSPKRPGIDITREVREQDVTWYVRRLPNGWHASPDAINEAARLGIELEPNETFVRAHRRNIGAEDSRVLGYHAVRWDQNRR